MLIAEVNDNGRGIPKRTAQSQGWLTADDERNSVPTDGGMGLRIMLYRAENAGAEICFESMKPGTRVICRISEVQGEQK